MALLALNKILDLERAHKSKRSREKLESRSRTAVLEQLLEAIINSKESETILECLITLKKDNISLPKNCLRDTVCKEVLLRCYNGDFSLMQLVQIVKTLVEYKSSDYLSIIDLLWVGFEAEKNYIDAYNLSSVFQIMKYFNTSKNLVRQWKTQLKR